MHGCNLTKFSSFHPVFVPERLGAKTQIDQPPARQKRIVCTLIAAYMCDSSHANGTTRESGRRKAIGPTGRNAQGSQFPNEELTFRTTVRKTAWLCFKKTVAVQIQRDLSRFVFFMRLSERSNTFVMICEN